jgi:hypothetical protein
MSNLWYQGIIAVIVLLVLFLPYHLSKRGEKREQAEQKTKITIPVINDEQRRLGSLLFEEVQLAARNNPNMDVRRLRVAHMEKNAGAYSVMVYLEEPHWKGCMMQFDIFADRLHWLYGPYGPEENQPLSDFDAMLEKAKKCVIEFT